MAFPGDLTLAHLLERKGIRDTRVLDAIASLNRADFVPPQEGWYAHDDRPLPIGYGQTISQPYIVAFMTQALGLLGGERVLEVGTGSGYQTAVLARLGADVYSIEIVPELARQARERFAPFEAPGRISLREGDAFNGWPEAAPFDAILVAAAPPEVPQDLLDQLAPGGRLIVPVGPTGGDQELELWRRLSAREFERERLFGVRFVPLVGQGGGGLH